MRAGDLVLDGLVNTPAFICDEVALMQACSALRQLCRRTGVQQLFPMKCHSFYSSLEMIALTVDGFAVSSVFEARLAREVLSPAQKVHFTSPGLRDDELLEVLSYVDGISFNSFSQLDRSRDAVRSSAVACGMRVNPRISFVRDKRYDPCAPRSRLGVPLSDLAAVLASDSSALAQIDGLHLHTNCDSADWSPLLEVAKLLDTEGAALLHQCRWVNLGGGYLLAEDTDLSPFEAAVDVLQRKYGLTVVIEPGAAVVRDAWYLVSRVVDTFRADGVSIAVLDTSVNHIPEAFEYQFSPDVMGDNEEGRHTYLLTGSTCLAGDVFGEYAFDDPLVVGSVVTFTGVGAYTLVKSHTFNGLPLPAVYVVTRSGEVVLRASYGYEEFASRCGARHESLRDVAAPAGRTAQFRSASAPRS